MAILRALSSLSALNVRLRLADGVGIWGEMNIVSLSPKNLVLKLCESSFYTTGNTMRVGKMKFQGLNKFGKTNLVGGMKIS